MKFFALYNYMFEKCIDTDDIFNDKERLQEVEENFARRQACFDDVLVDDYTKTQRIHFTNARGTQYLHHFLLEPFKEEGVYVLRILKNCRGTRHDETSSRFPSTTIAVASSSSTIVLAYRQLQLRIQPPPSSRSKPSKTSSKEHSHTLCNDVSRSN